MNPDVVKAGIVQARASGQSAGTVQGAVIVGGFALVVVGVLAYISSQQTKAAVANATAVAINEGRSQGYHQVAAEQKFRDSQLEQSRYLV